MRAFLALLKKEFIQLRRDKAMLRITLMAPIVQLLFLGYAVNTDVKRLATDVYDFDQSQQSREFVRSFEAGEYFIPQARLALSEREPLWELDRRFESGQAELAVIIPEDFSERISTGGNATIGIIADGSDANAARTGFGYAGQIVRRYSEQVSGVEMPLEIRARFLYNPELESVYFMVPGIVATLLTIITMILTAMGVVREKEAGTLEQLVVTPISGSALLAGKICAFGILGLFEMAVALTVGVIWFGIPFAGSPLLLFALAALYLLTTLGMGTFFSTITSTQQQAMFLAWFFSIFALLTSGFFTPISNMPQWMQKVTLLNPMSYFMTIVRAIMMKGAGVADLLPEIAATAAYGLIIFSLAALRFRKRAA